MNAMFISLRLDLHLEIFGKAKVVGSARDFKRAARGNNNVYGCVDAKRTSQINGFVSWEGGGGGGEENIILNQVLKTVIMSSVLYFIYLRSLEAKVMKNLSGISTRPECRHKNTRQPRGDRLTIQAGGLGCVCFRYSD